MEKEAEFVPVQKLRAESTTTRIEDCHCEISGHEGAQRRFDWARRAFGVTPNFLAASQKAAWPIPSSRPNTARAEHDLCFSLRGSLENLIINITS